MNTKSYYVYILTNQRNTVLYVGVTNDISRRAFEHKAKINKKSFTARYNINKLVYWEEFNSPQDAILEEKRIKGWTRNKKIELIRSINPELKDLMKE